VIGFAFASGCAGTPYQPKGFTGGYTDTHLKNNLYYVEFSGNAYLDRTTAIKYLHRRAKELCEINGYNDYELMDEKDSSTIMLVGSYGSGSITASTMDKPVVSGYVKCIK
jgi:hypothetical protein